MDKKVRVIAYYLPQYHPIPENDAAWGKGFTEWINVASAKPLFRGHYQPRVPADLGFYDLRVPEVREQQAEMAFRSGIEGFMYWHYWFGNGRQLLERPFNEVLAAGKPDFPFCLGWANHSWKTTTWTAKNKSMKGPSTIMLQEYLGEEDYIQHFYSLLPAFKDHRYIKVDNKPFFLIYNLLDIPNYNDFIELWQDLARKNGLEGIHFVGNIIGLRAELRKQEIINSQVDAVALSNLTKAEEESDGKLKAYLKKMLVKSSLQVEIYEYKDIIENYHTDLEHEEYVYPVIYPQLDRTPRAGKQAVILNNSTPELFKKFLQDTVDIVLNKQEEHRIILLNAWNEWGEGNYVEPDQRYGAQYLHAMKEVLLSR